MSQAETIGYSLNVVEWQASELANRDEMIAALMADLAAQNRANHELRSRLAEEKVERKADIETLKEEFKKYLAASRQTQGQLETEKSAQKNKIAALEARLARYE